MFQNQFLSIVMFGMKGFYILANGAIHGHHGLLVSFYHNGFKGFFLRMVKKWDCVSTHLTTNFRLFLTKKADDNFKFDENGRKLSKGVEMFGMKGFYISANGTVHGW